MERLKPRQLWLRFSLRSTLVVVTMLAIVLGWVHRERELVRKEKVTIAWVDEMGGQTYVQEAYGHDPRTISWWEEQTEKWFGEKVETVHLMRTYVNDLTPLAELSRLESVYLGQTEVTDLSPLAGLENLDTISLTWGAVGDLSPLSKVTSLEVLELDQTQVSDLSPLAELTDLRILYLAQTQVSDLSPLAELKKLEELRLTSAPVSDLSPLMELKSLVKLCLEVDSEQVSEKQLQELRQTLPNCKFQITFF